jgi:hypothetical protein
MEPAPWTASVVVIAAGYISRTGEILRGGGRKIHIDKEKVGRYHVIFDEALSSPAIVVATSDGGLTYGRAEVVDSTVNGFHIEGQLGGESGAKLADIGFSFVACWCA